MTRSLGRLSPRRPSAPDWVPRSLGARRVPLLCPPPYSPPAPSLAAATASASEQPLPPTIPRHFLGWDRPFLRSLCDYLFSHAPAASPAAPDEVDLSAFIVVLPGSRAGRRLLELLVQHAEGTPGRAKGLRPPRILTIGALARELLPLPAPPAGTIARRLAWAHALSQVPAEAVSRLVPGGVAASSGLESLGGLAAILDSCHAELAGDRLTFADVAERGADHGAGSLDHDRWLAAAHVQQLYLEHLARAGLCDEHHARSRAVEDARPDIGDRRVLLAGITDLTAVQRRLIDTLAAPGRAAALIFAPSSLSSRFDAYGCVIPSAWADARIDLPLDCLHIVDSPADQAAAALDAIAGAPPDQVTIGVPDQEVTPHIERLASRTGVPVRRASGLPGGVARAGPLRLLLALADLLEDERPSAQAFAALVRHPDTERWLISRRLSPEAVERWLTPLDEYHSDHLNGAVPAAWLEESGTRRDTLTRLAAAIDELVAPLRAANSRPLREWAEPIMSSLRAIYSDAHVPDPHEQRILSESCAAIRDVLVELAALDPRLDTFSVAPAAALRLVAAQAALNTIPAPADEPAVELLGWLELALDDAPLLVITGMNEGRVPASISVDPLLPDRLRSALGITDNQRRYVRDAFALSAIAASRSAGGLAVIAGRFSSAADPISPSRLLFACDDALLASRVRMWTAETAPAPRSLPAGMTTAERTGFRPFPAPEPPPQPIERISITAFRNYLASPYGFYLQNILRLDELDDADVELDPLAFGNLLHDCLSTLSHADIARSTDADRIEQFLAANLEALARQSFGEHPIPAVWVQLQQARARIRAFARWQAAWAAAGWRIYHTEWSPPPDGETPWAVDGKPILLRGRIDRIDHNDGLGRWAILDYKTGDKPPSLDDTRAEDGSWLDLQLPLYRHLAAPLNLVGPIDLGYIVIPKKAADLGDQIAQWDTTALASADEAARQVIRAIREGRFAPPGDQPPTRGILGVICGQGLLAAEPDDDEQALLEEGGGQ